MCVCVCVCVCVCIYIIKIIPILPSRNYFKSISSLLY